MMDDLYRTRIDECDVLDKDALICFRSKRKIWLDWLNGDDDHAIVKQINLMSWHYAVFRLLNESRRLASSRQQPAAALNATFAEFADAGFVAVQALAVRRLMEPAHRNPDKQVISLRRLVDDVVKHQHLFSRECFVGYDGCPFDPEPAKARWWERTKQRLDEVGSVGCWSEEYLTHGPEAWEHAQRRHVAFDKLAAIEPSSRQRQDKVKPEAFAMLESILKNPAIESTKIYCDKMIAHAADEHSRSAKAVILSGLSFQNLDIAHRAIITVAEFVAGSLLHDTVANPIPVAQFDILDQLDASYIDHEDREELSRCWHRISEERESWVRTATERMLTNN